MKKTLADFKRLAVKGSKWQRYLMINGEFKFMGESEIVIRQSNAIAFKTQKPTPSWLHFPTAKEIEWTDSNTIIIKEDGIPLLKYVYLGVEASND